LDNSPNSIRLQVWSGAKATFIGATNTLNVENSPSDDEGETFELGKTEDTPPGDGKQAGTPDSNNSQDGKGKAPKRPPGQRGHKFGLVYSTKTRRGNKSEIIEALDDERKRSVARDTNMADFQKSIIDSMANMQAATVDQQDDRVKFQDELLKSLNTFIGVIKDIRNPKES